MSKLERVSAEELVGWTLDAEGAREVEALGARAESAEAECARLREALAGMERLVAHLLPDRSEQHARINGAGRTTPAEVVTLARARLAEIQAEERAIRSAARAALAGKGGAA